MEPDGILVVVGGPSGRWIAPAGRGTITPVIDRRFALSETAEAVRRLGAGHLRGKVIITTRREFSRG